MKMKHQSEAFILVKFTHYTILILLQNLQNYNCQPITPPDVENKPDIKQLQDAKLIKSELLEIIKNAENFIKNLDEWAIHKTVNITKTDQLTSENIKQVENEISLIKNKINELNSKLGNSNNYIDINKVSKEKREIEDDLKLLEDKFKHYIGINLRILGEFYDDYFKDIVNKKDILKEDMTSLSARVDEIKREQEMLKLLEKCANAIMQQYYLEFVFKLKLLKTYKQDLKVIFKKLYKMVNFDTILAFANNIENVNISTQIYLQIYEEINNSSDDSRKIRLIEGEQEFFLKINKDKDLNNYPDNLSKLLIEPWKGTIKLYLYKYIKESQFNVLRVHQEVINKIADLNSTLVTKAFEDLFDEIINVKGQFTSSDKDEVHEIFSRYFNAMKTIISLRNYEYRSDSDIINLAYQTKNQLSILSEYPYFYRLPNDGIELKNAFPKSVKNLVFSDYVCIKSDNYDKYLESSGIIIDGYNNLLSLKESTQYTPRPYTLREYTPIQYKPTQWKILRHNNDYEIISNDGKWFADNEMYNFGRIVYLDKYSNQTDSNTNLWQLYYSRGGIRIKNIYFSQFLQTTYDYNGNTLVTLQHSPTEWLIEDCSSINPS